MFTGSAQSLNAPKYRIKAYNLFRFKVSVYSFKVFLQLFVVTIMMAVINCCHGLEFFRLVNCITINMQNPQDIFNLHLPIK